MISAPSDYRRHQESLGYDDTPRNSRRRKVPPLSTAPTSTRVLLAVLVVVLLGCLLAMVRAFSI